MIPKLIYYSLYGYYFFKGSILILKEKDNINEYNVDIKKHVAKSLGKLAKKTKPYKILYRLTISSWHYYVKRKFKNSSSYN